MQPQYKHEKHTNMLYKHVLINFIHRKIR